MQVGHVLCRDGIVNAPHQHIDLQTGVTSGNCALGYLLPCLNQRAPATSAATIVPPTSARNCVESTVRMVG